MERLKGGLFGSVDPNKVLLWHLNPPHPYSGSIWFRGSFVEKNGHTELSGRFGRAKGGALASTNGINQLTNLAEWAYNVST